LLTGGQIHEVAGQPRPRQEEPDSNNSDLYKILQVWFPIITGLAGIVGGGLITHLFGPLTKAKLHHLS
jgi:hypothetical protein